MPAVPEARRTSLSSRTSAAASSTDGPQRSRRGRATGGSGRIVNEGERVGYRRILVVTSKPSALEPALARALELAHPAGATLTLMTSVREHIRGLFCSPYAVPLTQAEL